MKARPILFSAPEIRALLAGTKTQTRRVVKPQPVDHDFGHGFVLPALTGRHVCAGLVAVGCNVANDSMGYVNCPYGAPGDLLWVRETTIRVEEHGYLGPVYASSEQGMAMRDWGIRPAPDDVRDVEPEDVRLRPAIHMPRKYSRLTLRITDVRVQRLQEISEADARAEGASWHDGSGIGHSGWRHDQADGDVWDTARTSYFHLWSRINGEGSVAQKDWTWALTFEVIQQNVDAVLAARGAT